MISSQLQACLNIAYGEVLRRNHEYLTTEHLLFALLKDAEILQIISACGGNPQEIGRDLDAFLDQLVTRSTPRTDHNRIHEIQSTLSFQRVMQRAALHVQSAGKSEITTLNVLVALFSEKESYSVYFLQKQNVYRLDVVSYISHGIPKPLSPAESAEHDDDGEPSSAGAAKENALRRFTVNLNEKAAAGKIDPLIGRARELERTMQILCRRHKNNPLYVGEAGVGKTAIAEGLALHIVQKKVPRVLADAVIYSLDMGALLAGTKFRGDFEQRLKDVLACLRKEKHPVLFIDEIHTLIGAGATSGGTMDASNLLKPALASGEIKCIGATTYQEYRSHLEKDRALSRRFQKIDVAEPSADETFQILKGLQSRFEESHKVHYSDNALRTAATLSARYLQDRRLPDKAIDVIDEAGAAVQVAGGKKTRIGSKDVEDIISKMANIPPKTVSVSDKAQLRTLAADLKLTIFGQDDAISRVAEAIKLSRSGLGKQDSTVGNFLFTGPTGVGKTELAKELARVMGISFVRFDMSEYMEKHTVSRLIGSPPGYVGFDQGGLLTDAITKTPHAVLLLDEIEKAHPDVFNLLLQVMDYGTLTDNNGKKVDFRHIILIMTTNAGARDMSKRAIGMIDAPLRGHFDIKAIEKLFTPEFRNRLDAVVPFAPLSQETIISVVDKFLNQLELQLLDKKVEIEVDDEAKAWLAQNGFDILNGARPMARLIQEKIKRPLADEILFGRLERGGTVKISENDDELVFSYESPKEAKPLRQSTEEPA